MSVYQKKNGKWYCRGKIKDERYNKLCDGAKNFKEAKIFEDALRFNFRQQELGLIPKVEKIKVYTISFMMSKYLDYSKANKKTFNKDITHIAFFKEFFGSQRDILSIKPVDIDRMKIELKSHKNKRGEPLANGTVNRYLSSLKKAYNVMKENQYINYNPCCGVKKMFEDNNRVVILPEEKQAEFLQVLPSKLHRDIVLVALHTGLRKMNVLGLCKRQVNIKERRLEISKSENKGKKDILLPLNSLIFELIKEYYDKTKNYLFINPETGMPYTSIARAIKTAGKKVGVDDLHFHDLRRTFGTRLCQKNASLRVIQELLGHSSISTTQRYLSVGASEKESAMELLVE